MTRTRIAVIGGGSIGVAWAVVFARAGHQVSVFDVSADRRSRILPEVSARLADLVEFALVDEEPEVILIRVSVAETLADAVAGAGHVQECVVESLAVKQELFAVLDKLTNPDVILASSTSMIASSRFAAELEGRARCLVAHPGNPPYLMPVVELAPAPFTDRTVVERTAALMAGAAMVPVLVEHEPEGFVFNRLQGALLREAYCLVRDGVISATDLDRVVSAGVGRRWSVIGPFATAQLNTRGGIERHAQVMGPGYARMGAERGQDDPWTEDLVAGVASDVQRALPPAEWTEQVALRDRALMQLEQARRSEPELFESFNG